MPIRKTRYGLRHIGNRALLCDNTGKSKSKELAQWAEIDETVITTPKLSLTESVVGALVDNQNISIQGQAESVVDFLIEKGWVAE
jgi:hypothetical protein